MPAFTVTIRTPDGEKITETTDAVDELQAAERAENQVRDRERTRLLIRSRAAYAEAAVKHPVPTPEALKAIDELFAELGAHQDTTQIELHLRGYFAMTVEAA